MDIKYIGEKAISYLVEKCKATFALITHTHTASEIGADEIGSASAALALAEQYTDEKVSSCAEKLGKFTVTIEYDGDTDKYSADKTYDEITEAIDNKSVVEAIYRNYVYRYAGKEINANRWMYLFERFAIDESTDEYFGVMKCVVLVREDNVIGYSINPATLDVMVANKTISWLETADKTLLGAINELNSGKANSEHSHSVSNITDLQASLDETLANAKDHAETVANTVKNDLLNGAGEAYDTLKELSELIDENHDAIEALDTVAANKADKEHTHDLYESKSDAEDKLAESKTYTDEQINTNTVGKKTTGKTYTIDNVQVTAQSGAEIFNNYEKNKATGTYAHAEGNSTTATGSASHAEGSWTIASRGSAHAEGEGTTASGAYSHAQGYYTTASGEASHAEGNNTTASGSFSHAEGIGSKATGNSHAEGGYTTSSGQYAHSEGWSTNASGQYQHVQGKYNIVDSSNVYAHIVGNGNGDKRSNAHTLDWSGNAWYAGSIYIGGTSQSDGVEVALKPDLDELATELGNKANTSDLIEIKEFINEKLSAMFAARIGEITLSANSWTGSGNLYSQVVSVAGVTENSQVDLTPSIEQLAIFYEKDISFVTENDGGVVTVYVIGQKPENDYTIQVTITEVAYE